MKNLASEKVGNIVASNFRTSRVLTAYGIDFCCKGGVSLREACERQGAPLEKVIEALEQSFRKDDPNHFDSMPLDALVQLILDKHHEYIRSMCPALKIYLEKLCRVHGERHPEIHKIRKLFDEAAIALMDHMLKEEIVLFPFIQTLVKAEATGSPAPSPSFGHIDNPIQRMELEHETEGERFHQISTLSNDYQCPSDGCQTYMATYALLKEFEEDLHQHIHLENNILFPKAKELFARLSGSACGCDEFHAEEK